MVLLPFPTPLAKPVLLTVATEVFEELQVTEFVRFCVLPSLYLPVAVNCCVLPFAIDGFAGVTVIDESTTAPVTFRFVEPVIEPEAA